MTGVKYPLAAEIESLLNAHVPAAINSNGQRSRVEGPIVRGQRAIYRAICPGFRHPLFIKRPYEPGRTAQSQYDALSLARERLHGQCGLLVPNAYPYLLDEGFIMMDWFSAPTIKQILHNPKLPVSDLVSALVRTGQWLRSFHGHRDDEVDRLKVGQMLNYVLGMADDLHRSRNPAQFNAHLALLKLIAPTTSQIAVPTSYSHGDFKPDNVLFDGDRIITVDIDRVFKAPVVHDLTHFLVHLEMHLLHPAGWRFLPWHRRLRSAFLFGYGADLTVNQTLALSWLALQRTLQSFYEDAEEVNRSRSWVKMNFLQACYVRCARLRAQDLRRAWNQMEGFRSG